MGILELDIEEGTISEDEINRFEGDEDIYLDRFTDPFL